MVSPERQAKLDSDWNNEMPWGPIVIKPAEELAPADDAVAAENEDNPDGTTETEVKRKKEWS